MKDHVNPHGYDIKYSPQPHEPSPMLGTDFEEMDRRFWENVAREREEARRSDEGRDY